MNLPALELEAALMEVELKPYYSGSDGRWIIIGPEFSVVWAVREHWGDRVENPYFIKTPDRLGKPACGMTFYWNEGE